MLGDALGDLLGDLLGDALPGWERVYQVGSKSGRSEDKVGHGDAKKHRTGSGGHELTN